MTPRSEIKPSPSSYYQYTDWEDFFVVFPRRVEGKLVMFKMCQWRQKYYTDNVQIFSPETSEKQWRIKRD